MNFKIINTELKYADQIYDAERMAYYGNTNEECDDCLTKEDIAAQLARFSEGQFLAIFDEKIIGSATSMLTNIEPGSAHTWYEMIGDKRLKNHEPDGKWLYGVELFVVPSYRRQGIGSALYEARKDLVKEKRLKGIYFGGMLMGYHRYAGEYTPLEYGLKVVNKEITDPTVTMQMNRGLKPIKVIENYVEEPDAADAAVLLVWENPNL